MMMSHGKSSISFQSVTFEGFNFTFCTADIFDCTMMRKDS
jgi:hypothetical protein